MIAIENIETAGWEAALRGMRNPLDSWNRADSEFDAGGASRPVRIGPNDEKLMRRLIGTGTPDHCKFRRMIAIWCDVTAPLYWWKEADTYKVGTVANSCSTMHTLMNRPFDVSMFSCEDWAHETESREYGTVVEPVLPAGNLIRYLNAQRDVYLELRSKGAEREAEHVWRRIVQLLPESWNQRRTWMLNYEVMANIYRARRHHKLGEWRQFVATMVFRLPHAWVFTAGGDAE